MAQGQTSFYPTLPKGRHWSPLSPSNDIPFGRGGRRGIHVPAARQVIVDVDLVLALVTGKPLRCSSREAMGLPVPSIKGLMVECRDLYLRIGS
jgi:hypothetical protein